MTKDTYRAAGQALGVTYGGVDDDGLHCFVKTIPGRTERIDDTTSRIIPQTYAETKCWESEVFDGSLALLLRLGMTR